VRERLNNKEGQDEKSKSNYPGHAANTYERGIGSHVLPKFSTSYFEGLLRTGSVAFGVYLTRSTMMVSSSKRSLLP
jgi:hypothetical protein